MLDLEKEINKNKALEESFNRKSESEKNKYAQALLNGIGEQIKNEIGNPPKIIKRKNKIKQFFRKLFSTNRVLNGGIY